MSPWNLYQSALWDSNVYVLYILLIMELGFQESSVYRESRVRKKGQGERERVAFC